MTITDDEVEYQLVPLPAAIINLPGRSSTAIQELVFEAENVPPLGFTSYHISPIRDQLYIKITVDKTTGLLESFQHVDGIKISLSQNFYFYSQTQQVLQSGAYSFRPEKEKPTPVTDKVTFHTIRGPLVKEIRQRFNDWIIQVVRLHRGEEFVEIEWIVGPVPIGTDLGKEIVTIYQTNISNNDVFYTDSNSRQMIKRSCWNESSITQQRKPVSSCYAPVSSRICIEGNSSDGMCVLTDRTMGGVGREGGIEIMVHRRLLTDDGFGLDESLNEEAYGVGLVVRGKHRLYVGNYHQEVDDQTFFERTAQLARKWMFEPWPFMTSAEKINRRKWQNIRNKRFSVLRLHGLPRHIHVLTLEPWKGGSVLLRLENTLESYHDDGFGLDESLNEEAYGVGLVVRGKHRLYVGNYHQEVDDQTFFERTAQLARKWMFEPWPFMTSAEKINRRKWQNIRNKRFSVLRLHGLPRHIHVLTLEPWKGGSVLLRLENTLESYHAIHNLGKDLPHDVRNAHITVELRKIFLHAAIKSVRETTLAANQWLEDARQMDWSTRYVYAGGDDGLLPEDNPDYIDDLKFNKESDNKDNEHVMEERYPRRKEAKQRSSEKDDSKLSNKYSYSRTKRSSNNNDTLQTNYTNDQTINITDNRPLLGFDSRTFVPKNISETGFDVVKTEAVTKKYKKSKYRTLKARPLKFFRDLSNESDEIDEDIPVDLKKRSSKRKNATKKFTSYTLAGER
nr:lysosomal alpha-mannosidase-like [Danaus plexippus plexippus]